MFFQWFFWCGQERPHRPKNNCKCNSCGHRLVGGERRDKLQVITEYIEDKQTAAQLANKYGINERTIRRDLTGMRYVQKISKYKQVTIYMDTTEDETLESSRMLFESGSYGTNM